MKPLLLLCFTLLFCFPGFGQQLELTLTEARASRLLEGLETSEVVDLRSDKSQLGWVWNEAANALQPAVFRNSLAEELKTFTYNNQFPLGASLPVIVKVNKLHLSERVNGKTRFATAEIALEFLVEKEDNSYCLLLQTGYVTESTVPPYNANRHEQNLATVIEACFRAAAQKFAQEKCLTLPTRPTSYLTVNSYFQLDPQTIPILATSKPSQGGYRNFHEFQQNSPGLEMAAIALSIQKPSSPADTATSRKLWGFSDGMRLFYYFKEAGNYFELTRSADHFTFDAPFLVDQSAEVKKAKPGKSTRSQAPKGTPIKLKLDPVTGKISPAQD